MSLFDQLANDPESREDFLTEMRRFLPAATIRETVERSGYWTYLVKVVERQCQAAIRKAT